MSLTPKFWHTYVIKYSDFMVIVEPCIQMSQVLKIKCNFTLRWLVDLASSFLEQSLSFELFALYPWYFFVICWLAAPWLTCGYYQGNSLTHQMLITVFGLSIFGRKRTCRAWVSTPNWVPSGLWSQWHNPLSHSPQIAENTLPGLVPSYFKMLNCLQYQKPL